MKSWIKFGLGWGAFMFVIMNVVFPLWDHEKLNITKLLIGLPVWLIFGLIFGFVSRKKPRTTKKQIDS